MKIPISKTILNQNDIKNVSKTLESGWLVQGPKVKEFEDQWSNFTNAKYSIAVTSCTTAMYLSLVALGFKKGDEAIVPALTWISTANVVEQLGGRVIFCDIDLKTFNLDVLELEKKITKKTKFILPVHLFGLSADMDPIINIAKDKNIKIVEDAACGFGSYYKNKHVGTFGDVGCFSLHPRKSITTGEGGIITTNNEELAKKIMVLRDHGAVMTDLQRHLGPKPFILSDHVECGYNARMTDIQGALGCSQMLRANDILKERKQIAKDYIKFLDKLEWLDTPFEHKDYIHSFQSFPCLYEPNKIEVDTILDVNKSRNRWMEELNDVGISTRPATHAVHTLSYYSKKYNLKPKDFFYSWAASLCSISFPLFNGLKKTEINHVIKNICEHKL